MNRVLVFGAIAALLIIGAGGAAVYAYFFSGLRSAPNQLSLSATASPSVSASATQASTPSTTPAGFAGKWSIASGSVVGIRVLELFAGESAKHEAVMRTSTVSGGLTIAAGASGYDISGATITVGLVDLHSVDQVAGHDVTQRDGVVQRQLNVSQFPTATFTADSVSVPPTATSQKTSITLTGTLTIDGVGKHVTVGAQEQVTGAKIEIAGTISTSMSDFGIGTPHAPFVTVDNGVTVEFDVFLTRAA